MNISQNGIAFLKQEEGFIAAPKLGTDKLCWGYGHNRVGIELVPRSITVPQAETLLQSDLVAHVATVNKLAPWANQNQFDALVSFAFNAGDCTLSQMLSHGRDSIPAQLPRWIHACVRGQMMTLPVLVARRG